MERTFTVTSLLCDKGRTFEPDSIPQAVIDSLRPTIAKSPHQLARVGYSLDTIIFSDGSNRIRGGLALLFHEVRQVAVMSVALFPESSRVIWNEHFAICITACKLSGETIAALEDRWLPTAPWLLVDTIAASDSERYWLDDFTQAWAATLRTVAMRIPA